MDIFTFSSENVVTSDGPRKIILAVPIERRNELAFSKIMGQDKTKKSIVQC